jgi:hypothetical protein
MWGSMSAKKAEKEFQALNLNSINPLEVHDLSPKAMELRESLLSLKSNYINISQQEAKFGIDVDIGMILYQYLDPNNNPEIISMRDLASKNFWIWIAFRVMPEIIIRRYNLDNEENLKNRFYKRSIRIYPFMLWWGIHLVWQGSEKETRTLLNKGFSITALETLLDRNLMGYNLELYRKISKKYSEYSHFVKTPERNLLRPVMVLHSSKYMNIDPNSFEGGLDGYVNELFIPILEKNKKGE